jgi:hypothetical protein
MGNGFGDETAIALDKAKRNAYIHNLKDYNHYGIIYRSESFDYSNLDCLIYKPTKNELAEISNAVNVCQSLNHLNLSRLRLTDDDFIFFIRRLNPQKVSFKRLTLSDNELSDESMSELCNFMNFNRTMTNIDLSYNRITDRGFSELGSLIVSKGVVIESISLEHNRQTSTGNLDLLHGMFYNKSVTFLSIETFTQAESAYKDMFIARNNDLKMATWKQRFRFRY